MMFKLIPQHRLALGEKMSMEITDVLNKTQRL